MYILRFHVPFLEPNDLYYYHGGWSQAYQPAMSFSSLALSLAKLGTDVRAPAFIARSPLLMPRSRPILRVDKL
jgi:hypothetical protein